MSDVITGPGMYRQRDGGKAEVFAKRDGWWYGRQWDCYSAPLPESWLASGRAGHVGEEPDDITGPWYDPPEKVETWVPTCELRWQKGERERVNSVAIFAGHGRYLWDYAVLEQRWTCNGREEWRAVEVTP